MLFVLCNRKNARSINNVKISFVLFDTIRSTRASWTEVADFVTFSDRLRLIDQCVLRSPTTFDGSFDLGALLLLRAA